MSRNDQMIKVIPVFVLTRKCLSAGLDGGGCSVLCKKKKRKKCSRSLVPFQKGHPSSTDVSEWKSGKYRRQA